MRSAFPAYAAHDLRDWSESVPADSATLPVTATSFPADEPPDPGSAFAGRGMYGKQKQPDDAMPTYVQVPVCSVAFISSPAPRRAASVDPAPPLLNRAHRPVVNSPASMPRPAIALAPLRLAPAAMEVLDASLEQLAPHELGLRNALIHRRTVPWFTAVDIPSDFDAKRLRTTTHASPGERKLLPRHSKTLMTQLNEHSSAAFAENNVSVHTLTITDLSTDHSCAATQLVLTATGHFVTTNLLTLLPQDPALAAYPGVANYRVLPDRMTGFHGDFIGALELASEDRPTGEPMVCMLMAGTLNRVPHAYVPKLLAAIHAILRPDDMLLIGAHVKKATLADVWTCFPSNQEIDTGQETLKTINRILNANFMSEDFGWTTFYDTETGELVPVMASMCDTHTTLNKTGDVLSLRHRERIVFPSLHLFNKREIATAGTRTGFKAVLNTLDKTTGYCVTLLRKLRGE